MFLGGSIGALIVKIKDFAHHFMFPVVLIAVGLTFKYITYLVLGLIQLLPFFNTLKPFQYQYEPVRFCQVLIFIGIIILGYKSIIFIKQKVDFQFSKYQTYLSLGLSFALGCYLFTQHSQSLYQTVLTYIFFFVPLIISVWKLMKWNYRTFLKIGQNTLSVYVLHVILLYRGLFGFKFGSYFKDNLSPFLSITGAIVFIFLFLSYTQYQSYIIYKLKRLKIRYKIVKRKIQYKASLI